MRASSLVKSWLHNSIASHAGVLELEGMLQDDRLNDHDRLALATSAASGYEIRRSVPKLFTAPSGVRKV
jgi:hypothetical protein